MAFPQILNRLMRLKASRLRNKAVDPHWQHEENREEDFLDAGMRLSPQCWWSDGLRESVVWSWDVYNVLSGCGFLGLSVWCGSSSQAFHLLAIYKMQDFKQQGDESFSTDTVGQKVFSSHQFCKLSHLKRWEMSVMFGIGKPQLWETQLKKKSTKSHRTICKELV